MLVSWIGTYLLELNILIAYQPIHNRCKGFQGIIGDEVRVNYGRNYKARYVVEFGMN